MDEDKQKPIMMADPDWESGGKQTVPTAPGVKADVPAPGTAGDQLGGIQEPEQREYGNYQDVIDYLEEQRAAIHMPSKEELEKERRRRRTEGIISQIADGASAISNLITTTQYAPDMYNPSASMSDATRARYDRIKKEREADADRYLNYSLMMGKMKDAADDREYKRGRDALQDRLTQIKAAYNARMADIKYQREAQKLDDAKAAAAEREASMDLDRQIKEARLELIKSQTHKNNQYKPSSGRGGGGGGTVGQYTVSRINPKTGQREYKGGFKSEQAARNYATTYSSDGWTYVTTPTRRTSTKPDKFGYPQTSTSETNVSTKGANTRALAQQLGL